MTRCKNKVDTVNQCKNNTNNISGLCWRHDINQYFVCRGTHKDGTKCKMKMKTDKRCKRHDGNSIKKLFQCMAILKRGPNKGNRCSAKIENEDDVCKRHIEKIIQRIEHEKEKCSKCGKPVEWASMKLANCDYYDISTIGEIYSYSKHKYLEISPKVNGYIPCALTDNNGKSLYKHMNTFQGIVFYGLPIVNDGITVDHIDGKRSNNRICCNLRLATKTDQNENQNRSKTIRGKTVLKISLKNEDIIKEYKSASEAANECDIDRLFMGRLCRLEREYKGYLWRYKKKEDFGNIKWISSAKEFPNMPLFYGSEEGHIASIKTGYISKGTKHSSGYMNVKIKDKNYRVNILICTLFHGPKPLDKLDASHLNLERDDNRESNLAWMTRSENMKTTVNSGLHNSCKPVRAFYEDGTHEDFISIIEACNNTNATNSSISEIFRGRRLTSGTDKNGFKIGWELIS